MMRTAMMMFALAVSSMTAGCLDDDQPVEKTEVDPDDQAADEGDEQPANCHQLQDGDEDQTNCTPPR